MTYAEFLNEAARVAMVHQEWRWGQTLYNVLKVTNLDLAVDLCLMPELDPFYDDAKVPAFLTWLEGAWR